MCLYIMKLAACNVFLHLVVLKKCDKHMNISDRKVALLCRLVQTEWWFLNERVIKMCIGTISKACVVSSGHGEGSTCPKLIPERGVR